MTSGAGVLLGGGDQQHGTPTDKHPRSAQGPHWRAGAVTSVDYDKEKVYVDMTKDQIKDAPDLDEQLDRMSDDWDRDPYESYYRPYIW